jgi:hypothetical protein
VGNLGRRQNEFEETNISFGVRDDGFDYDGFYRFGSRQRIVKR